MKLSRRAGIRAAVAACLTAGGLGVSATTAPGAGAEAAAEVLNCSREEFVVLRQVNGPGEAVVKQTVCNVVVPGPPGNAAQRSARIVIRGDSDMKIKATVRVELHDCQGPGVAAREGTWQAAGNHFQVTTNPDRRGQTTFAQGRNSSIYVTRLGKAFSGGGLFQRTSCS